MHADRVRIPVDATSDLFIVTRVFAVSFMKFIMHLIFP